MRYPRLIAHRCGGAHAPENTLAGLHVASRLGFAMAEFDVMLASCGTPVLIHDETLERTTNGSGAVCNTPYSVLRTLDAGQGEHIPTLREALSLAASLGLALNVEIKPAAGFEEDTARVVAEVLREAWGGGDLVVSSFAYRSLEVARSLIDCPFALLVEDMPADWHERARAVQAIAVHCDASRLKASHIAAIHAAGLPVVCYTVNDAARAQALFASGVSAVFTDRLLPQD